MGFAVKYKARLVLEDILIPLEVITRKLFLLWQMNTVRVLIYLAANLAWSLQQFDVRDLKEVYEAPLEFDESFKRSKECKLNEALYELKQFLLV